MDILQDKLEMDGITVLIMLSIAILVLLIFIILRSSKADQTKRQMSH